MVKSQSSKKDGKYKGKAKAGTTRRGRKSGKEIMENLFQAYSEGTPNHVKSLISGWEQDVRAEEEEDLVEEHMDPILTDLGNTRSRLSLFQQSIRIYWALKCLLVKAIVTVQKIGGGGPAGSLNLGGNRQRYPRDPFTTAPSDVCLRRIDKQLQNLHQVDMPGSSVKDPTPIESSED